MIPCMLDIAIPKKIYAIVDCNSFYASCERVFNGRARKHPVAVLSNNDGCIIARTDEVKKLGITMADPVYKHAVELQEHGVMLFSSNFTLYADLSKRVMRILSEFAPHLEVYSIDEAFLDITNVYIPDYTAFAKQIRETILECIDIPVSVGIADTKTLAKAANKLVKIFSKDSGILNLHGLREEMIDTYLSQLPVEDVWGIGSRYAEYVSFRGVTNARELKYYSLKEVKRRMHIVGERTVMELHGIACIPFQEEYKDKKGILSSKAFSSPVKDSSQLIEAVSTYMARAAEKLRAQNCATKSVSVFLRTNHFDERLSQYSNSFTIKLPFPTSYTPDLIKYALLALDQIFIPGYLYHKAGVFLDKIIPDDTIQNELFGAFTKQDYLRKKKLMEEIDKLNFRYGHDTVFVTTQGVKRDWKMKQAKRSQRYSTRMDELLRVKT